MSEMIERVGTAIAMEMTSLIGFETWDALDPKTREKIKEVFGRAGIEAMRNPTEAMLDAPEVVMDEPWNIKTGWYSMIEAALKED